MKLLLYCTKAKPYLEYKQIPRTLMEIDNSFEGYRCSYKRTEDDENFQLNGKIVAECDFEVEEIGLVEIPDYAGDGCYMFVSDVNIYFETKTLNQDKLFKKSCLNWEEMEKYLYSTNGKGYAIHIKNLHIFDESRDLDFYSSNFDYFKKVERAPQNMMYAYDSEGNKYVVISIQPQWLCKILNGEKTIEVRKKVLKEMLNNEKSK